MPEVPPSPRFALNPVSNALAVNKPSVILCVDMTLVLQPALVKIVPESFPVVVV